MIPKELDEKDTPICKNCNEKMLFKSIDIKEKSLIFYCRKCNSTTQIKYEQRMEVKETKQTEADEE